MDEKYTTVALKYSQHLTVAQGVGLMFETYMFGFTDNKRDKQLDGWYINKQVKKIE